jgi:hypothetical protein
MILKFLILKVMNIRLDLRMMRIGIKNRTLILITSIDFVLFVEIINGKMRFVSS